MKGFFEGSFDRGTFRTAPAHVQGARLKAGAPRAWYRGYQRPDARAIVRTACAALLLLAASSLPAHAVCNSPPGGAGDQIYNSTHNVMQYCNGNQWIAMGSGGGGGGGSDTLGDLSCNSGESIEFDGTNWGCVGGKVSRAGDTMTGTLDVSTPTAGTHAATKAYVDAAVAGVAGASGGGGGVTCYYVRNGSGSCGTGFDQMPGEYRSDGSDHKICCTGASGIGDDTPATFDFPASPAIAANAGHTWTPIEVTGFDSATVSITGTNGAGLAEYRVCSDAACTNVLKNWRTTSTGITAGNYLQIRIGAATAAIRSDGSKVTVSIGSMSDDALITSTTASPYFIAFVTSNTWSGNLGNVSGATSKCQSAANAAGLAGTYRAWIATGNSDEPRDLFENVNTTSKFVMPNNAAGVKLVDSWADLVDGTIDVNFQYNELGSSVGTTSIRTNVTVAGAVSGTGGASHCNNWNDSGASQSGNIGRTDRADSDWTADSITSCATSLRLYCFQTVLPN